MSSEKDQIESSVASDGSPESTGAVRTISGIHERADIQLEDGQRFGLLMGEPVIDSAGNRGDLAYVLDPLDLAYLRTSYGDRLSACRKSKDQIQELREALLVRDSQFCGQD